jgi:hypothetical protein
MISKQRAPGYQHVMISKQRAPGYQHVNIHISLRLDLREIVMVGFF